MKALVGFVVVILLFSLKKADSVVVRNPPANVGDIRDSGSNPGSGRSSGGGHGNPTPVSLPGESHEQRILAGYSPWCCKELNMTE